MEHLLKLCFLFCIPFYDALIMLSIVELLVNGDEKGRYLEGRGRGLIEVFAGEAEENHEILSVFDVPAEVGTGTFRIQAPRVF
jgi:hypothetical protein